MHMLARSKLVDVRDFRIGLLQVGFSDAKSLRNGIESIAFDNDVCSHVEE
jgi:hypothetical protein